MILLTITLSILLSEGVPIFRAAPWAAFASFMKFVLVEVHRGIFSRISKRLTSKRVAEDNNGQNSPRGAG